MTFVKYPSLENHTNSKFIEKCFETIINQPDSIRTEFVAREKIHGTNFSIKITKDEIICNKRPGPIAEGEKFYNYQSVVEDIKPVLLDIQNLIKDKDDGWNSIQIYGELAGDGVQKEVKYGPLSFYVFDIYLDAPSAGWSHGWWPDDSVQLFCDHHGLKIAPLIARGTLESMLKLPVEFESVVQHLTWGNMFGVHKQLPPAGNTAEGLVIKPNRPLWLPNGSRLAIKYKTDAFKEKGKSKAPVVPVPLSEFDKSVLDSLSQFATPARIKNVASHIGEINDKMFGKILGLTMKDLLEEAEREGFTLDGTEMPKRIKDALQKIVSAEIRKVWIDLIN